TAGSLTNLDQFRPISTNKNPEAPEAIAKVAPLWYSHVLFPSPLPSPSGRGSIIGSAFDNPSRLERSQRRTLVLPLPEGEGKGEGERALETTDSGSFAIGSPNSQSEPI